MISRPHRRSWTLLLTSLVALGLGACGDKDDGSATGGGGETGGDEGGGDEGGGDEGGGDEGGDDGGGDGLSCTVLGTEPPTLEAGAVQDLEVLLDCNDGPLFLETNFAVLLGGATSESPSCQEESQAEGWMRLCFDDVEVGETLLGVVELSVEADGADAPFEGHARVHHFIDDWQGEVAYLSTTLSQTTYTHPGHFVDWDNDGSLEWYNRVTDGDEVVIVAEVPGKTPVEARVGKVGDENNIQGGSGLFKNQEIELAPAAFDGAWLVWDAGELSSSGQLTAHIVPVAGLTLSDIENKKIRPDFDKYGLSPTGVVDIAVVGLSTGAAGEVDLDVLVLFEATVKDGSSAWALYDSRDGSLSSITSVGGLSPDDEVQLGFLAGPKDTAAPEEPLDGDQVLVWSVGRDSKAGSSWKLHVWSQDALGQRGADDSPLYEDAFTDSINPLFQGATVPDLDGDGLNELVLRVAGEGGAYVGVFTATDGASFDGDAAWLSLDGEAASDGATPVGTAPVRWMAPESVHKVSTSDGGSELAVHLSVQRDEGGTTRHLLLEADPRGASSASFTFKPNRITDRVLAAPPDDDTAWPGRAAVLVGGGASVSPAKDVSSEDLVEGELVFVGQSRDGGPVVLARATHPDACDSLGVCGSVIADLGDGQELFLHEDGSVWLGETDLSEHLDAMDLLFVDEGGLARKGDVTLIRREASGESGELDIVVVSEGELVGTMPVSSDWGEGFVASGWGSPSERGELVLFGGSGDVESFRMLATSEDAVALAEVPVEVFLKGAPDAAIVPSADGLVEIFNSNAAKGVSPPGGPAAVGATLSTEGQWLPHHIRESNVIEDRAAPDLVVTLPWETGTACPWATVLLTGQALDEAVADATVLDTADESDCSDLEVPVLAADLLGAGSPQLLTARTDGHVTVLKHYVLQDGELKGSEQLSLNTAGFGASASAGASAGFGASAGMRWLSAGDLDGDGLQDLYCASELEELGGAGVIRGDGAAWGAHSTPKAVLFEPYVKGMIGASKSAAAVPSGGEGAGPLPHVELGVREVRQP